MKGEENTSGMIIVFGVLIITLLTMGVGMSMFGGIELPESEKSNLSGENIEAEVAEMADDCWRKGGKGTEIKRIDCFRAEVNLEREVKERDIARRLEELPGQRLKVDEDLEFQNAEELRITYAPETRSINVSRLR